MLIPKAKKALERYGHELVIANLLTTRKKRVVFVESNASQAIALSAEQETRGVEIEELIVDALFKKHTDFSSST